MGTSTGRRKREGLHTSGFVKLVAVRTIFRLNQTGTLTTLYTFCSLPNCADGSWPLSGLIQASDGNFYGTTYWGGAYGNGTVFEITPAGTLTTVYSFNWSDGGNPSAGLVQAARLEAFMGPRAMAEGGATGRYSKSLELAR